MSKLTKEQREIYESNLKAKEDYYNSISYAAEIAAEAATEKARKERDKEIIANAKKLGMSNQSIVQLTGLPLEEIEKIGHLHK